MHLRRQRRAPGSLRKPVTCCLDYRGFARRATRRRSTQPVVRMSYTLHFSANFLIARSTMSATVEVDIARTSPISR